ncbi:MAG: aldo/keto reductase [Oscillospiraceae bacterium]|nr:aldo/keto reductase [Oscillospiraceae bacterium]MBR6561500.1 aldo/keto reductase [Oscillospiraceae bacterium]
MQYSEFQGKQISRLGFGLMRLPVIDQDQSKVDYDKTEEMVLYAYENGINYFDTAYPYHNGFSEKTLGQILTNNHLHGKFNVATKLFTLAIDEPGFDPRKMLEEQLTRLQADHIDFYLVHGLQGARWDTLRDNWDIQNFLRKIKEEGLVRHVGFSFHDEYPSFVKIMDDFDWEFAQIQYNYLDNEIQAGDAGVAYAREKGVPLVVMEPLKGGSLILPDFPEVEAAKQKHGLADVSNAELALRYIFDQPGFLTVLSGMSTMEQLKENIEITDRCHLGMMDDEARACIDEIRQILNQEGTIPCTSCRYCCDGCPQKIAIPSAFRFYNEGKRFHNPQSQLRNFNRTCTNLADCVDCGQCVKACPQHLDIPALLKEVRSYFGE